MVYHKEIMDKAIESEGKLMVDFGISLPDSCFTLVRTDGYDKYYKINCYGDWWWGKCDHLKIVCNGGLETYSYELGYFKEKQWIPMFGWRHDCDSII